MWSYQYLDHVQLSHPDHTISKEELEKHAISRAEFDAVLTKEGFKPTSVAERIKAAAAEGVPVANHLAKFWTQILD